MSLKSKDIIGQGRGLFMSLFNLQQSCWVKDIDERDGQDGTGNE